MEHACARRRTFIVPTPTRDAGVPKKGNRWAIYGSDLLSVADRGQRVATSATTVNQQLERAPLRQLRILPVNARRARNLLLRDRYSSILVVVLGDVGPGHFLTLKSVPS